ARLSTSRYPRSARRFRVRRARPGNRVTCRMPGKPPPRAIAAVARSTGKSHTQARAHALRSILPRSWSAPPRSSAFAQHEIDDPAPANMRGSCIAAVVQDIFVLASGVLKGIGQNRHRAEVARIVHLLRESNDSVSLPRSSEGNRAKGITEYFTEEGGL